jgi:sugar phosphate isomerase/epimerase
VDHTQDNGSGSNGVGRRDFFKAATAGMTTAAVLLSPRDAVLAQESAQKAALERIASNCWPVRSLFKSRAMAARPAGATGGPGGPGGGDRAAAAEAALKEIEANPNAARALEVSRAATAARANLPDAAAMKKKYGELTLMDFPAFTKEHFPGVARMDLFSGFFGDVTDDSMFFPAGANGRPGGFDPLAPSSRKWLDALANTCVKAGTAVQHISNNAPSGLADYGSPEADARRKAGVELAKRWLEGCHVLGVKSMRMNSPQALGPSIRPNAVPRGPGDGYPRNIDLIPLLEAAIESHREMADFGGKLGIKVTIENHWGLAADPMNIRTIIDEVNHPYCEASPDFGNWEHEYNLVNGLKALAPYASSNVHAKFWDRWGDRNNVQRSVRIMLAAGFRGTFALEYEQGPLDGLEGAKYLYREVLAALTTPTPAVG